MTELPNAIPAKAGIQAFYRHRCIRSTELPNVIPAKAGIQAFYRPMWLLLALDDVQNLTPKTQNLKPEPSDYISAMALQISLMSYFTIRYLVPRTTRTRWSSADEPMALVSLCWTSGMVFTG